jgi:ABC-2 type transport system permease protein
VYDPRHAWEGSYRSRERPGRRNAVGATALVVALPHPGAARVRAQGVRVEAMTEIAATPKRYARLLWTQLRASILLSMQYRLDFLIDGGLQILWAATALVPLVVVFRSRGTVAGWTFEEALLVTGWFTLLQGVLEGAINPSLTSVVEHVRKGTLDFLLLKPADAQFLVSTARLLPWRATNILTAGVLFAYSFHARGSVPSVRAVAMSVVLLFASVAILYSLWMLTVSAAFYVVKVDNLTFLFSSVFDAARWPSTVFRGGLAFVFTFVLPLAVMTTYPAQAMLDQLPWERFVGATVGAVAALAVSRLAWTRALASYTSAGG